MLAPCLQRDIANMRTLHLADAPNLQPLAAVGRLFLSGRWYGDVHCPERDLLCESRPCPDNGSGDSPRPPFLTEFVPAGRDQFRKSGLWLSRGSLVVC